jgi:hypothetical protein
VVGGDLADGVEEGLDDEGRQPHAHLVDQQDLRLLDQGTGHGQHLLLAAGEGAGREVPALLQGGEDIEQLAGSSSAPPLGHLEVLLDGQGGEQRPVVGDEHDPRSARGHRVAVPQRRLVDADGAGVGGEEPGEGEQQRRLAGAVGPEQGEHDPGLDVEVEVPEGDRGPSPAGQPRALQSDTRCIPLLLLRSGPLGPRSLWLAHADTSSVTSVASGMAPR